MDYIEFLKSKIDIAPETGINITTAEVSPALKPHQRDGVVWAVRGGRRALFEAFGLGKTVQELEFCRIILKHEGGRALIVMPLEVRGEFIHDAAELLGMEAPRYITHLDEAGPEGIYLTNYERVRDGDIDPRKFTATSLDEASVLRNFGSKTYQTFLDKFKGVKYKLVATATPAPNKYKELIHYAGYLEVMDTGQALTRFFNRDSMKANNLTLYPGKEREFWLWVSSWALYINKPSDLGYSDEGYDLPPMDVRYHKLDTMPELSTDRDGQERLYEEAAVGMVGAMHIKRNSVAQRVRYTADIVNANPDEHFILWHDLEAERKELKRLLPDMREIYGTQDPEQRAASSEDFANGRCRLLGTKKELSGSGCNFQRYCHRAIFVGIDFEFNDFIQAIHRIYRFLQTEQVIIDIIYLDSETEVLQALQKKWAQYNEMTQKMAEIVREYRRTAGTVENFTRTTATASQQRFIKLLDKAHFLVNSGAVSYTRAVEETVKELASEQTKVHYPSGHVDTIETAVLRAVRTGVGQASGNMAIEGMIEHDWDIILVSAHLGARYGDGGENPGNHFWWQGKFYSRTGRTPNLPDFIKCTGYGTGEGLCGWNCRHNFGPGDGEFNPYKSYDSEENKRAYDLSQKQRGMEARIRRTKAKMAGLREAGMDDEYNKAARLLERQNTAYLDFCRENELKPLMERIQTAKWSREDARRSVMAAAHKDSLKNASSRATINGMEKQNATREYLDGAAPGKGLLTYDADYVVEQHQNEVRMADWLHNTFGGDIRLLTEANEQEVKTADFLWRGKLWDLKTVTTEKAANSAVRKGLQQIRENPGGVILDYRGAAIDLDKLSEVVEKRLKWRHDSFSVDIMLVLDNDVQVWRY